MVSNSLHQADIAICIYFLFTFILTIIDTKISSKRIHNLPTKMREFSTFSTLQFALQKLILYKTCIKAKEIMEDRGNVEKKKEKETAVPRQARYNKYDQHDNK